MGSPFVTTVTTGLRAAVFSCALAGAFPLSGFAQAAAKNKVIDDSVVFSTHQDTANGRPTSMTYNAQLPTLLETKLGVDFGVASPSIAPDPGRLLGTPGNGNSGAAWATLAVPATPLGIDRAALDAKLDSAQDTGRIGVALSRKLPISDNLSLTLKNSYDVTSMLPQTPAGMTANASSGATQNWETNRVLRLDLPQSATAFSAGEQLSTVDEKWLRTFSAEQKIYGPLSITGSISETPTGELDKVVKAGFKKTW